MPVRSAQWGGVAGIAAVGAFIAESALLRHTPSTSQPTQDVVVWFGNHRSTALVAVYLPGFGVTSLLFFAGALRQRLRRDDDADALATVGLAGGVGLVVKLLIAAGALAVLAFRADTDPAVARALYDANALLVALAVFPASAFVAASSVAALTSGVLPRWLTWSGLGLTVLQLLGAAAYQRSGPFMPQADTGFLPAAMAASMLWIAATSIALLRDLSALDVADRPATRSPRAA
jgi:hypothetical protein